MHQLYGFVDRTIIQPHQHVYTPPDLPQSNPAYTLCVRLDQLIRACLFATVLKNHLTEVRDLSHAITIWERLESHFNSACLAHAMDLKHLLMNLVNSKTQPINVLLQGVKNITDSLVAI